MVGGQSRKIVVLDLDGTWIDGNSLHLYFRTAWKYETLRTRAGMLWMFGLRALRLISHRRMKFTLMHLIVPDKKLLDDFAQALNQKIRPEVRKQVDAYRAEGAVILLATAAPETYIPAIWEGDFVATPIENNPNRTECRGENKLAAVRRYMQPGDILYAVFTDHDDDLPLLNAGAVHNHRV